MALNRTRIFCEIVGVSVLGALLLAGTLAWRLSQGPLELNFLSAHIEEAINGGENPVRLRIGGTRLDWAGWDRTLDIRLTDVRVAGREDERVIARIPEMSVTFSLRALLQGVVAPTSFDIIEPRIRLVRNPTGEFAIMMDEKDAVDTGIFAGLATTLDVRNDPDVPISFLRRISILDARVRIDDRVSGVQWRAPEVDLVLLREQGEIRATMFGALDVDGTPVRLDANAAWKPEDDTIDLTVGLEPVRLDRLAGILPALAPASALELPVSGRLSVLLGTDGHVHDGSFEFHGDEGRIDVPDYWKEPLAVSSLDIFGRFSSDPGMVEIETFNAVLGGAGIGATARLSRSENAASVEGEVRIDRLALDDFGKYWPEGMAANAREWVLANMSRGTAEDATAAFSLRLPDLEKMEPRVETLSGTLRLRNVTVDYVSGMPKIENLEATAVFGMDRFVASVTAARAGGLTVERGEVRLTGLDGDEEKAAIDLTVDGPLDRTLALIDSKPLDLLETFDVKPEKASGRTHTDLSLNFPLIEDLKFDDVAIAADSRITRAALPNFAFGQAVEEGDFRLKVDRKTLDLEGAARLAGIPAQIKWIERFEPDVRVARHYEVSGTMQAAGLPKFGLPDLSPYVQGPLVFDVAYLKPPSGVAEVVVKAGLRKALLYLPGFDWRKSAGPDALAWLTLGVAPGGQVTVRSFDLRAPDLRARGEARIAEEGKLQSVEIERLDVGRTALSGRATVNDKGEYDIVLKGRVLDATPFIEQSFADAEDRTLPPMRIAAEFDRVWFDSDMPVENVKAELIYNGTQWSQANIAGTLGADHSLIAEFGSNEAGRAVRLTSDNAGATLRALDFIDTMQNGQLVLQAVQPPGRKKAPWEGTLDIRDFTLVKAPIMTRVLSLGSFTGIRNALTGQGIGFASLNVPFRYDRAKVTVENARAVGSDLGFTASGVLDLKAKSIAVDGTIVPAYTINSVLGNIPLVGKLFTGSEGSGVFAATYKVTGALEKPDVSVNPLAALAPGFLRDLLGIFDKSETPAPGTPEALQGKTN